ncbi:MAG: hypothetical protein L0Y79_00870 [Chlorobi bacterium]|nr:hypothetical protein [Chlorobiota bacterium]MCI0715512.1 hypothetical protein [Chlorobiota bacterium]
MFNIIISHQELGYLRLLLDLAALDDDNKSNNKDLKTDTKINEKPLIINKTY